MKKSNLSKLVFAALLCFITTSACAQPKANQKISPVCNDWIHPDSVAYQTLGRTLTDVLINANKVNVYSLFPKENLTPDDFEVDNHFIRKSFLGTLTKDQATVLKYMLISNGANYHKDTSLIIMSPYTPVVEFEFIKKKQSAHVIISLIDYSWKIKYDDKEIFRYNFANGTFIGRFCKYFLNKQQ